MKQKRYMVLCCVVSLLLAGCVKMPEESGVPELGNASELQLKMLADTGDYLGTGTETSQGYYFVDTAEDMTHANLKFIDKETEEEIFLCSDPGCEHNSDSCTSFISLVNGYSPELISLDNKLILMFRGINVEQAQVKPHVETLNFDGSGRETVYTFEANQEYSNGIVGYGNDLYLIVTTYFAEGTNTELVKIDLKQGEVDSICELDPPSFLMGAYDHFVVLKTIGNSIFSEGADLGPDVVGKNRYSQQEHQIFTVDVTSGQKETVLSWKQDQCVELISGNKAFLMAAQNGTISLKEKNLDTQGEQEFEIPLKAEDSSKLTPLLYHNGCLIFELIEGYQENGALLVRKYVYNLVQNTIVPINLYDPVRGYPLTIEGTLGSNIILREILYTGSDEGSYAGQKLTVCKWEQYLASHIST